MAMMVQLARSGLTTSRLAYGTSRLHYVDRDKRTALLEKAVDAGFTHIDTAPSYGDTLVESEIGRVLRPQRDRLVIATKYGIPPNPLAMRATAPRFALPLNAARAVARRLGIRRNKRPPMTAQGLRQSVEESLRRLQTDWLDILLLHEPTPDVLLQPDEIHRELVDLQSQGHIRCFGLSGAWAGISGLGDDARLIGSVIQTGETEWPESEPPDITYGAIAAGGHATVNPAIAIDRLRVALARRPSGVVLFSTTNPDHLRDLVELEAELEQDREVAAPLSEGEGTSRLDLEHV